NRTICMSPMVFELGDRLRLRKPHPCGSYEWLVIRLGADIGLRCVQCGRRVLLPRPEVERRTRAIVSHASDPSVSPPLSEK
ncbi:MAG: DUF951 domain-containing protein, partial [Ktedonobacteraceae bacterium]